MDSHLRQSARFELKMACDEVCLPDMRSWLQLHPAAFVEAYPPRQVNNVYMDTYGLRCVSDVLMGVSDRSKLRFRWYGVDDSSVRGVLELKCRSNYTRWKESCSIPHAFNLTAISWGDWMQRLREHARGTVAVWLSQVDQPTLLNRYWREYYETVDERVRVTLDYDQRACSQIAHLAPNLTSEILLDRRAVIEFKFDPALYQSVSDMLSRFPVRVERYSKYVNGMTSSVFV